MSTLAQFSCSKFIFQQERASIIISDVISNKTRKISARGNASNNKWHIMEPFLGAYVFGSFAGGVRHY
jgi:hypothetical protein